MPLRYRRATPAEAREAMFLLAPDRRLFSDDTWRALPELLADLVTRERILLCVLEDSETGQLRFMGGSAFLTEQVLEAAARSRESVLELALATERQYGRSFLNTRQIALANRRVDLRLLNFFGVPFKLDPHLEVGKATEAWNFFHKGFQFRDIWVESADPVQARMMTQIGMRTHRQQTARDGEPFWLFHITREEALTTPASWPASAMLSPPPRLGFTRGQQKLLELALLDWSDRDVAKHLALSEDAVKKRWRAIYARVMTVEPTLLRSDDSGAVQRRTLLQRLRQNLEELRPF